MSWLARTFFVFYADAQNTDEADETENVVFFHPPVNKGQQLSLSGACMAAARLVHDFGTEHNIQTLEIGDAKLGFHHESEFIFVRVWVLLLVFAVCFNSATTLC
jgi:hypothetical protein